jgi:hypothetical protein
VSRRLEQTCSDLEGQDMVAPRTCEIELSRSVSADSLAVLVTSLIPMGDGELRPGPQRFYTISFRPAGSIAERKLRQ